MPETRRFQVIAYPKLRPVEQATGELDHVEFVASREGEPDRSWRVEVGELDALFDVLKSRQAASDVLCDLHDGVTVTVPGDFSAVELVLLGFRVELTKAENQRGKANLARPKFTLTLRKGND